MKQVKDGDIVTLKLPGTMIERCCDCGLTHFTSYWYRKGILHMKVFRDEYETKKARRKKK